MPIALKQRFACYAEPWEALRFAAWYLLESLTKGFHGARDRSFATWLVGLAKGIIVELGPGTGSQLPRFNLETVQRIYGVEPNAGMFASLLERIDQSPGLEDVYVPIHAVMEDEALLAANGILQGTIDTVVCMQVLCSVSDPARAVERIHSLLKPGGQLLFWEHEASSDTWTRLVQHIWNVVWTPLVGGCTLGRDIEAAIFGSGRWSVIELVHDTSGPYSLMPRVWGRLIKIAD
ncbi:unnamed protein product [Zymoseptoria tritici ST99CH_3D7]|uniref:Methyltransferase type 11 domain-containing protein n=1 Tax=Zymoseptoria tritici (strain ST99CH_3D7) TaxID=1276538 RepID=A0A1X7RD84_ZYMT9|nr:unnamed protein product [Zymoseptoria tritici ST99CH_3D7]